MRQIPCYFTIVLSITFSAALISGFGILTNHISHTKNGVVYSTQMSLSSSDSSSSSLGRRNLLKKGGSLFILSQVLTAGNAVQAKETEPIALSTVRDSFQAVRDELNSGGVASLVTLIENEDYEKIMDFTKEYDLEFRKAKMGKARKFLTSKDDKEKAVALCNAVTFDLIGMNKASRVGQRDIERVKKYYGELKADIETFLELEKNIDESEYVF